MKRLGTLSVLTIVMLMMLACGGGTTSPPAVGTASTGTAASSDDDVQNVIWMTKNDGHPDGTITAACIGTTSSYRIKAKRKQKVRWFVQNDPYNPCPKLDADAVEVRFDVATMTADTDPMSPALSVIKAVDGRIQARVHANKAQAPDGEKRKYVIFYKSSKASPDPEIDINGDCGGCGPP